MDGGQREPRRWSGLRGEAVRQHHAAGPRRGSSQRKALGATAAGTRGATPGTLGVMQDLAKKTSFLTWYVEVVCNVACSIQDDHLARIFGRAEFLAVDAFLKLAPTLKNELVKAGSLSKQDGDAVKTKVKKLESDYESYYARVRDKLGAHQQSVSLGLLLETWNEIDEATLTVFRDDVTDIWSRLEPAVPASDIFPRPQELAAPQSLIVPASIKSLHAGQGVVFGIDRVALTRLNTPSAIPAHAGQEKAQRVVMALDVIRQLIDSGLRIFTANWLIAEKAVVDLVIVDACALIDNLFVDDPSGQSPGTDPCLYTIWQREGIRGAPLLAGFQRNQHLEEQLRRLRNKFCAHVDGTERFDVLLNEMVTFPLQELHAYLDRIWRRHCQAGCCAGRAARGRHSHSWAKAGRRIPTGGAPRWAVGHVPNCAAHHECRNFWPHPNNPHPNLPRPRLHGIALLLTRERDRPELVGVAASAFRSASKLTLPEASTRRLMAWTWPTSSRSRGSVDVSALEQDLEVGGPALLGCRW